MNNLSSISYNLQALFMKVNMLNGRMDALENQILQLQKQPSVELKQPSVDLAPIEKQLKEMIEKVKNELQEEIKSIKGEGFVQPEASELLTAQLSLAPSVPSVVVPQGPATPLTVPAPIAVSESVPVEPIPQPVAPVDDIVISMTQSKAKGGRKKKAT